MRARRMVPAMDEGSEPMHLETSSTATSDTGRERGAPIRPDDPMGSEGHEAEVLARAAGFDVTAAEVERLRTALARSRAAMWELRAVIGTDDEPATKFSPEPRGHVRR